MRRVSIAALWAELEEIAKENDYLLYGRCVVFALAMHKLSGLPLFGLTGYDEEIDREVLVHAYVRLTPSTATSAGLLVDVRGPRPFDEMWNDFWEDPAMADASESAFTPQGLARLGTGRSRCPSLHSVMPIAERVWGITEELRARRVI